MCCRIKKELPAACKCNHYFSLSLARTPLTFSAFSERGHITAKLLVWHFFSSELQQWSRRQIPNEFKRKSERIPVFWQRGERRAALYMLTGAAAASLRDAVTPIPRLLQSTSVFKMINRRYTVTSFHLLSCCFRPFSTFCISRKQTGYSVPLVMSPLRFYTEKWSKPPFNRNDHNQKLSPAPPIIPVWCVIGCKPFLHVYETCHVTFTWRV